MVGEIFIQQFTVPKNKFESKEKVNDWLTRLAKKFLEDLGGGKRGQEGRRGSSRDFRLWVVCKKHGQKVSKLPNFPLSFQVSISDTQIFNLLIFESGSFTAMSFQIGKDGRKSPRFQSAYCSKSKSTVYLDSR